MRTLNRLWWAFLTLTVLGLFLISVPYVLSAYHLEQGARLLVRASLVEERREEGSPWPEPPLPTQSLAAEALARFQAAIAADPGNFQAHRWLGRAALALDRPEEAIAALSTAVRLHPANPSAWWDLGLAYGQLAPSLDFPVLEPADTPALASASQPIIIDTLGPTPALIPAIAVDANPSPTGYVATWSLPDAPDAWPAWWVPPHPVQRTVLLFSPPGRISFQVSLPVTPTALLFWMGMDPLMQAPRGDGVVYRVQVEGAEVFSHTLRSEAARKGWWPAQVDLTPWAGQTIRVTLILDPGPAGDAEGDQAGWGDLQLVSTESVRCRLASCQERAAAAWREGGFTAQDLIQTGEAARRAQRYDEALEWYARATLLGADLESAQWYMMFQSSQDWGTLEKSVLIDRGWIDEEMRLRAWVRWGAYLHEQQRDVEAEDALERAIATSHKSPALSSLLSEAYRFLGLSQWAQRNISEAVQSMKQAVELNDQNTWAHIHYGKVLYFFDPRLIHQTEHEFAIALEQNPGVDIWRNLIGFWRWVGEIERANQMCSQAASAGLSVELAQECHRQ